MDTERPAPGGSSVHSSELEKDGSRCCSIGCPNRTWRSGPSRSSRRWGSSCTWCSQAITAGLDRAEPGGVPLTLSQNHSEFAPQFTSFTRQIWESSGKEEGSNGRSAAPAGPFSGTSLTIHAMTRGSSNMSFPAKHVPPSRATPGPPPTQRPRPQYPSKSRRSAHRKLLNRLNLEKLATLRAKPR